VIDSGFGAWYGSFMKSKLSFFFRTCAKVGIVLSLSVQGCGTVSTYTPCEDDTYCWLSLTVDNGYRCFDGGCHGPCKTVDDCWGGDVCYEGHCTPPKYVPDAGSDAGTDASSAIGCGTTCTPYPEGWSSAQAVWHGPINEAPSPADFPAELGDSYDYLWPVITGYADLEAAPATCDICKCGEATGKCTELPASIGIRAAKCGEVGASIEFGGPLNWDGSCTTTYALPEGKTCPAGSSTLCAQSVAVSALGPPSEETCAPMIDKLPVLRKSTPAPRWKTMAVGYKVPGCEDRGSCAPKIEALPSGYRSCIYRRGENECPAMWSGERFVMYERTEDKPGWLEGRDCTPCECGTAIGSACVGRFRTFEDGTCTQLLDDVQVSSLGDKCTDFSPPGPAVGSKEITGLTYLPGFCEVVGGEPIGEVTPDPGQAVTFCCLS
jgi:hypothetical protein